MPKPVLSDSLFNADDVATAVLAEANLQVANSDLGVTDFSSDITLDSFWTRGNTSLDNPWVVAVHFNSLVFIYGYARSNGQTPSDGQTIFTVPSQYAPHRLVTANTIGYQADSAGNLEMDTSGVFTVNSPSNPGHANYYIVFNFWYKT